MVSSVSFISMLPLLRNACMQAVLGNVAWYLNHADTSKFGGLLFVYFSSDINHSSKISSMKSV